MIYPWDIARFRQALEHGLQAPEFEHFRFNSVIVNPLPIHDVTHSCQPSSMARLKGAASTFGRPAVPHCLHGVGPGDLRLPPSCTYIVPGARIIGLNAVLDSKGRLFSPDACADIACLDQAVSRNLSNAEGYVLRKHAGSYLASYFVPPSDHRYARNALYLGNMEINNYGSFLIRVLPQLLKAASARLDYDCYIASDRASWLRQALDLLGLPQKPIYLVQEVCGDTFDQIVIQSTATVEGFFDPETLRHLGSLTDARHAQAPPSRKLFVSRQLSRTFLPHYRLLTNEAEVASRFERSGFEIVHPETLDLSQQIALFAGAKTIAGASGSGMLNAVFAPPGGKVLDIESFNVTVRQHAKVYASTGKDYAFLFGAFDPKDDRDLASRRWSVDLSLIDQAIEWLTSA